MTLACEDGQQLEAHKVILAGQVLLDKLFYSHHHININNINIICSAAGKRLQLQVSQLPPTQVRVYHLPWVLRVQLTQPRIEQISDPANWAPRFLGPNLLFPQHIVPPQIGPRQIGHQQIEPPNRDGKAWKIAKMQIFDRKIAPKIGNS